MESADYETAAVTVITTSVVAAPNAGRTMATATVEITIEGIEFRVFGVRLVRQRDERVNVELPQIRDSLGRQRPCIVFPPEILAAIEEAVTREVVESVMERSAAIRP